MDNGTQLVKLASPKFIPLDLENKLRDKLDMKGVVSCPKAHEEQVRVERRIWLVREMLEKIETVLPLHRRH